MKGQNVYDCTKTQQKMKEENLRMYVDFRPTECMRNFLFSCHINAQEYTPSVGIKTNDGKNVDGCWKMQCKVKKQTPSGFHHFMFALEVMLTNKK